MDRLQVSAFADYLTGWRAVGVDSGGEEVSAPISPEMRAFVVAFLGDNTPNSGYLMLRRKEEMRALASFLREIACSLDDVIAEMKA